MHRNFGTNKVNSVIPGWYADEVFLNINGQCHYLWRAVDQGGDVVDILVQSRRNKKAALRFFPKDAETSKRTTKNYNR